MESWNLTVIRYINTEKVKLGIQKKQGSERDI